MRLSPEAASPSEGDGSGSEMGVLPLPLPLQALDAETKAVQWGERKAVRSEWNGKRTCPSNSGTKRHLDPLPRSSAYFVWFLGLVRATVNI